MGGDGWVVGWLVIRGHGRGEEAVEVEPGGSKEGIVNRGILDARGCVNGVRSAESRIRASRNLGRSFVFYIGRRWGDGGLFLIDTTCQARRCCCCCCSAIA